MTMSGVDEALSKEVGNFCRFYYGLIASFFFADFVHTALIFLTVFIAAPTESLRSNPFVADVKSIITEWDLDHESQHWIPTFLQSIFFLGFMFGTMTFGQLSDRYGRRYMGMRIYTLLCVVSFAGMFCGNWMQFAVLRFLGGLGVGGITITNVVMMQESTGSQMWAFNGNYTCISFSMTMLELVLIAFLFPHWKQLCLASSIPVLLGWSYFWFVPESPRWLYAQTRYKECSEALNTIARRNGNPNPNYSISPPEGEILLDKPVEPEKFNFFDLLKNPVLRTRSLILGFLWFTVSFVFYCVTLAAGAFSDNYYLAFAFSGLSQLLSVPITYYLMESKRFGRKGTFKLLMSMTAFGLLTIIFFPVSSGLHNVRLGLSILSKVGAQGAFTLVYIVTPEVFPTTLRNLGLGSMSTCARVGAILAPIAADNALHAGSSVPFVACGILCITCGVLVKGLPETRGRKVPNTLKELREIENI